MNCVDDSNLHEPFQVLRLDTIKLPAKDKKEVKQNSSIEDSGAKSNRKLQSIKKFKEDHIDKNKSAKKMSTGKKQKKSNKKEESDQIKKSFEWQESMLNLSL